MARSLGAVNIGTSTSSTPLLFYSRRIGLNAGRIIPIDGGGRLTGKIGQYAVGIMNIQTGDESVSKTAPTNFTVVRVKRDVLRRSSIGVMATNRSERVSSTPTQNRSSSSWWTTTSALDGVPTVCRHTLFGRQASSTVT